MTDDRKKNDAPKPADVEDSKGQYGGLREIGPGGGKGFEEVERPARPEDERLPSNKKD